MIGFELPESALQAKAMFSQVAQQLFRPISRKYDVAEHEYPKELNVLKGMMGGGGAGRGGLPTGDEAPAKDKDAKKDRPETLGANMMSVISGEEICYGDVGLMLSVPGQGLGNAAISAVATPEQKKKFAGKWAAMAITEPAAG